MPQRFTATVMINQQCDEDMTLEEMQEWLDEHFEGSDYGSVSFDNLKLLLDDSTAISELELSVRTRNSLAKKAITTLGQLRSMHPDVLDTFARVSREEIREVIDQ